MPTRWKVVIASVILFVWAAAYTLWDLLDQSAGLNFGVRSTEWGPSGMKKVWSSGVICLICFVIAIIGDILTHRGPRKPHSPSDT